MSGWRRRIVAATVEVLVGGVRAGTGVLVDSRHVLTAHHVVAETDKPVEVCIAGGEQSWPVAVVPSPDADGVDVAVLHLLAGFESVAPVEVSPWRRLPETVEVFGFPRAEHEARGVWRRFRVAGPSTVKTVQLAWEDVGTLPGHSGGPVVDGEGRLIGILVEGSEPGRFDRFVPLSVVERVWAGLRRPWLLAGEGAQAHLESRAFGRLPGSRLRGGDLFRGRTAALEKVAGWVDANQGPGRVLVVTGQPGAGKSAVVARAALAARRSHRGSGVFFHARDATVAGFVDAVTGVLGLDRAADVAGLLDQLETATPPASGPLVMVVDALDEAKSDDRPAIVQALAELAGLPWVRVVVATRPLADHDRYRPGSLLVELGVRSAAAPHLVDLDVAPYADPAALEAFVAALLTQHGATTPSPPDGAWQTYRNDTGLVARLARVISGRADGSFLVAALTANPLSQDLEVVDPAVAGFDPASLPATVGEAIDKYLGTLAGTERAKVRALLGAVAFARGAGVPDRLWLRFAAALGYPNLDQGDLDGLRDSAATDYLLSTSQETGGRVTRLYHQALIDQLLTDRDVNHHQDIFRTLREEVAAAGGWGSVHPYLPSHAADHAATAATLPGLLDDLNYLAHAHWDPLAATVQADPAVLHSPMGAVIQTSSHRARTLIGDQRMALLASAAAHLGLRSHRDRLNAALPDHLPPVAWAHTLGPPHRRLSGHTSWATGVAFTTLPDGRAVLASASWDQTVRLWDAATGTPLGDPLTDHTGAVNGVAFAALPDGMVVLASASDDHTVRLWDAVTGAPLGDPLTDHTGAVNQVAFAALPDGMVVLASASADGTVRLWDAATGTSLGDPLTGHSGTVRGVAFAVLSDERVVLASASRDTTVRLWDPATGKQLARPLTGHTDEVAGVTFGTLPGGRVVLASASDDATVRLWDPATGTSLGEPLTGHTDWVRAVAFATLPGGLAVLASASHDTTVRLWDAATGTPLGEPLTGHSDPVLGVACATLPNGRTVLASASADNTVRLWDAATGTPPGEPLTGHTDSVRAVTFGTLAGERAVLVSASADNTVRLWDTASGTPLGEPLTGHTGWVLGVACATLPGGRTVLASASVDATVRLWDTSTGTSLGEPLIGHTGWVFGVAFATLPDGRVVLASASRDRTVRLWDPATSKLLSKPLTGHAGRVFGVAFATLPDGRAVLASASGDATARLWDAATGTPLGEPLTGHTAEINGVAFATLPNGRTVLASASADDTVRLWDAATGTPLGEPLTGHTAEITGVAFATLPDGRAVLASASDDQTVRLWDPTQNRPIGRLELLAPGSTLCSTGTHLVVGAGATLIAYDLTAHQKQEA